MPFVKRATKGDAAGMAVALQAVAPSRAGAAATPEAAAMAAQATLLEAEAAALEVGLRRIVAFY